MRNFEKVYIVTVIQGFVWYVRRVWVCRFRGADVLRSNLSNHIPTAEIAATIPASKSRMHLLKGADSRISAMMFARGAWEQRLLVGPIPGTALAVAAATPEGAMRPLPVVRVTHKASSMMSHTIESESSSCSAQWYG